MSKFGQNIIIDVYGEPDSYPFKDIDGAAEFLKIAVINAGVTVITEQWHNFGQGYTGVIILAKSHISIYTWPEDGFAVIDICMYGDNVYFDKTVKHIETFFKTKIPNVITINRGIPIHNPLEDMKHLLKI